MNEIYATIGDYEEEDPYTSPYGLVLQIPFNAGSFIKIIVMKDECDLLYSFLYSIALKTLFRLSPNVICSLIMANVLLKDWIQFYLQSKACMTSKYSSIHPVLLGSERSYASVSHTIPYNVNFPKFWRLQFDSKYYWMKK